MITAAAALYDLGWPLVPCCQPLGDRCSAPRHTHSPEQAGKVPLLPFKNGPPSWEEVARVLRSRPCNLGVLTGSVVVAVEGDSTSAEVEIVQLAGDVRTVIRERRPGSGRAYLYRPPPDVEIANTTHRGESAAIDVRGRRGLLVVPPSWHASGIARTWVPGCEPWEVELAPLPAALLPLVTAGERATPTTPIGEVRPPGRLAFLLRTNSRLRKLWNGDGKKSGDRSRSGYDHAVAILLLDLGMPGCEVAGAIALRPDAHSREPDYCVRTVEAARRGKLCR